MERESAVMGVLASVHDPCCRERGISIVDMGLVRSVTIEGRHAEIELMLTSGWCPFAARILDSVAERVEALEGIDRASVEITWDEAWTMDRMSDGARAKLRFLPEPVDVADRDAYVARHPLPPSSTRNDRSRA